MNQGNESHSSGGGDEVAGASGDDQATTGSDRSWTLIQPLVREDREG